jgi:polysaccharide biosynthesis/export protein
MKRYPLLLVLFLAGCAGVPTGQTTTATPPGLNYAIQPGDVLTISVWKENDLQKEVLVRPDGGISFPLVGDIQAAGKSVEQLRYDLTAHLLRYIPKAPVSVAIKLSSGNKFYVTGKVNKPGEFVTGRNVDVMQALSMAGGMTPYASPNGIIVLRRGVNGVLTAIEFKYSQVESGRDLKQNIILQSGDTVVVP